MQLLLKACTGVINPLASEAAGRSPTKESHLWYQDNSTPRSQPRSRELFTSTFPTARPCERCSSRLLLRAQLQVIFFTLKLLCHQVPKLLSMTLKASWRQLRSQASRASKPTQLSTPQFRSTLPSKPAAESTSTRSRTERQPGSPGQSSGLTNSVAAIASGLILAAFCGCAFSYGERTIKVVPEGAVAQIWLGRVPSQTSQTFEIPKTVVITNLQTGP